MKFKCESKLFEGLKVKLIALTLGVILVSIGGSVIYEQVKINSIKDGCSEKYSNVTVGEVYDFYLDNEKWEYVKEDGVKKIILTGTVETNNGFTSDVKIIFRLREDTWRMTKVEVDDMVLDDPYSLEMFGEGVYQYYFNNQSTTM